MRFSAWPLASSDKGFAHLGSSSGRQEGEGKLYDNVWICG